MADWRILRGWSDTELERALDGCRSLPLNFDPSARMTPENGWRRHDTQTVVARERTGPPEPGGLFERAREAIARYEFSDPAVVVAHLDPDEPLEGRTMLLELKPPVVHYLAGVRVNAVRREEDEHETVFGYRYDTLQGHLEAGWEWFLLTKSHATGEIRFRIAADWREGDFPNFWSRAGFRLLGRHYQRRWVRHAHERLRRLLAADPPVPLPVARARLLHAGSPDPTRTMEDA